MDKSAPKPFTQKFGYLLDTREFQRLRRITQLGLTSYVFPGATHTRFSHSLGVAYLARMVLMHLREWAGDADSGDAKGVFNEVILAALLHDVGHGPFSHSFEQVLKAYEWAPLHEDWTAIMINNPVSAIQRALETAGINIDNVASAFTKSAQSSLPKPYCQIVSSQIDVDRMDYLRRDSHFAGVAIGQFDVHYLINSMVVINHGGGVNSRTLGLTPKGIKAYEAFLLARQLMNRTVYYHHNVKVLEFMVEQILRLAINHLTDFKKDAAVSPFLPPYFCKVYAAIQSRSVAKQQFMQDSMQEYVRLTEDAAWVLITAIAHSSVDPLAQSLAEQLLARRILRHYVVEFGKKDLLKEALVGAGFKDYLEFHVLDLKTTMYKGNGDQQIFVLNGDGKVDEVAEHSDTITAFRDRPEAESLLIMVDSTKTTQMEAIAKAGQFIASPATGGRKEVGPFV